jgi:cysteine desulfurase/selenocysteine lyase
MKNLPADILKDFPSLHAMGTRAYLDSASSSLTPTPVLEAMNGYYLEARANVHRGMYRTSGEASERYELSRAKVARFLNAVPEEIVFTRGATESLNLLAYALCGKYGPGDEIVLTEMEHHANLVPWQQMALQHGFTLKFIPVKPDFTLDMEAARMLIGPNTRLVSVVHASNVLGTVNPVKRIAELAHAAGAICIVDAAQSIGHRRVDVKELDCDFLVFSGHKMLGPTGIGILWGKKSLLEALDPFQFGGDMIREVTLTASTWNDVPWKFEAGTPNIAGAIGLGAAVDYLESVGLEAIEAHERALTAYAIARISAIPGLRVIGPKEGERVGAVAFDVPGMHPHDLVTLLDREGVSIRGGQHCAMPLHEKFGLPGTGRASFHLYNEESDADLLAAVIMKAKAVMHI